MEVRRRAEADANQLAAPAFGTRAVFFLHMDMGAPWHVCQEQKALVGSWVSAKTCSTQALRRSRGDSCLFCVSVRRLLPIRMPIMHSRPCAASDLSRTSLLLSLLIVAYPLAYPPAFPPAFPPPSPPASPPASPLAAPLCLSALLLLFASPFASPLSLLLLYASCLQAARDAPGVHDSLANPLGGSLGDSLGNSLGDSLGGPLGNTLSGDTLGDPFDDPPNSNPPGDPPEAPPGDPLNDPLSAMASAPITVSCTAPTTEWALVTAPTRKPVHEAAALIQRSLACGLVGGQEAPAAERDAAIIGIRGAEARRGAEDMPISISPVDGPHPDAHVNESNAHGNALAGGAHRSDAQGSASETVHHAAPPKQDFNTILFVARVGDPVHGKALAQRGLVGELVGGLVAKQNHHVEVVRDRVFICLPLHELSRRCGFRSVRSMRSRAPEPGLLRVLLLWSILLALPVSNAHSEGSRREVSEAGPWVKRLITAAKGIQSRSLNTAFCNGVVCDHSSCEVPLCNDCNDCYDDNVCTDRTQWDHCNYYRICSKFAS